MLPITFANSGDAGTYFSSVLTRLLDVPLVCSATWDKTALKPASGTLTAKETWPVIFCLSTIFSATPTGSVIGSPVRRSKPAVSCFMFCAKPSLNALLRTSNKTLSLISCFRISAPPFSGIERYSAKDSFSSAAVISCVSLLDLRPKSPLVLLDALSCNKLCMCPLVVLKDSSCDFLILRPSLVKRSLKVCFTLLKYFLAR